MQMNLKELAGGGGCLESPQAFNNSKLSLQSSTATDDLPLITGLKPRAISLQSLRDVPPA